MGRLAGGCLCATLRNRQAFSALHSPAGRLAFLVHPKKHGPMFSKAVLFWVTCHGTVFLPLHSLPPQCSLAYAYVFLPHIKLKIAGLERWLSD